MSVESGSTSGGRGAGGEIRGECVEEDPKRGLHKEGKPPRCISLEEELEELSRGVNSVYVDHSPGLLGRIYQQIGNETSDVCFVVGPTRSAGSSSSNAHGSGGGGDEGVETTREFLCHRIMFACCSDYFRTLLFGEMQEARMHRITLQDVPADAFEMLIDYVYCGRMELTAVNVMDMLSLSHRFAIPELLAACTEFLDECMNQDDVIRILIAAEYYQQAELEDKCWELVCRHASKVLSGDGVLELSPPLFVKLCHTAELQADEIDLFHALQRWASFEPEGRGKYLPEIVQNLRLPLICLRDLLRVVRPSKLVDAETLLDAVAYHADPTDWLGDPVQVRPRGQRLMWDVSILPAGLWVTDDDQTVTSTLDEWAGVFGTVKMTSGFHRWSVRVNKLGGGAKGSWRGVIGVCSRAGSGGERSSSSSSSSSSSASSAAALGAPGVPAASASAAASSSASSSSSSSSSSMSSSSPSSQHAYLPVTGFVVGKGQRKRAGQYTLEEYSNAAAEDGDVITVLYNAESASLSFLHNGKSLGIAYTAIEPPVYAALAIQSPGAMYTLESGG